MSVFIDLTGQKFGRLTVVERAENHVTKGGQSKTMWLCRCDCGGENSVIITSSQNLKSGTTRSCGCMSSKKTIGERSKTHGMTGTPLYLAWEAIKQRCENTNNSEYYRYGAIGRKMCKKWYESFEAFYDDVSKLPHFGEKGYTLDRIDNTIGYEPNNVRWADKITQANNRKDNHYIEFNGKKQSLSQWAREYSIPYSVLSQRINKYHWDFEKAISTPKRKYRN